MALWGGPALSGSPDGQVGSGGAPGDAWRGRQRGLGRVPASQHVGGAVISWATMLYGAGLSVLAAVVAVVVVGRDRSIEVLGPVVVAAFAGPVGWNAVLHATHAREFFTDAPVAVFPASWQDAGSGVVALAAAVVVLSLVRPNAKSSRTLLLGAICGVAAFLVDIYLY